MNTRIAMDGHGRFYAQTRLGEAFTWTDYSGPWDSRAEAKAALDDRQHRLEVKKKAEMRIEV